MTNQPSMLIDEVANAKAQVIFAHGAGADKSSDFMVQMTSLLNQHNINVLRFNFEYMDKRIADGKKYPPERMPKLLACLSKVLESQAFNLPTYLVGKSMGSRVAATLMSDDEVDCAPVKKIKGVMALGYPFHPQKKPEKLRLSPLQSAKVPVLILQGERDALGNKNEISGYKLPSQVKVKYFADGDHDLKPRVKSGFTHLHHLQSAAQQISEFIDEQC